tara:strand:- start:857 stop:1255 length:399 start_codon:yes stop_codon:yes gene_type:complete
MNFFNIFNLKLHHIGIIILKKDIKKIESYTKKKFKLDKLQGVRVLFYKKSINNFYDEYIVKEGKSSNQKLGFNHLCFSVENRKKYLQINNFIQKNKMGYPVSKLCLSGSKECNLIKFYFMKNFGLIELNILK